MNDRAEWNTVWEGDIEQRSLSIERHPDSGFYKVQAIQNRQDEGIAYQEGKDYAHVSPASKGEAVEAEASSPQMLKEVLTEMHFSTEAVSQVLDKADIKA